MFEKNIIIKNPTGLHARPATEVSKISGNFASSIKLVANSSEIDAKSVISIMCAGIKCGTEVTVKTNGVDSEKACNEIASFLENLNE